MPKSLLLVFPALLLAASAVQAGSNAPPIVAASERSSKPVAQADWFGKAVDHILDGRITDDRVPPPTGLPQR